MVWITTDNVSAEAWRHLLEYANHELAVDAIIKRHGEANKKTLSNYKKQAQQLRAAILQSKEYFDAAENSSLITSPNHLYYGMVSLCSAIMLLLGDGSRSLDKLRQDNKNNHHGLDFSTHVNATSCRDGLTILANSFTEVRENGFFRQWYSVLPTSSPVYGIVAKQNASGAVSVNRVRVGSDAHMDSQTIIGYKSSILELLKHLPDLNTSLLSCGVSVPSSRLDYRIVTDAAGQNRTCEWRIHEAGSAQDLQIILNQFSLPENLQDKFTKKISENGKSCIASLTLDGNASLFSYPSYRETINNESIMYGDKQLDTPEIVDAYLAAYGLSMLSRYFPDIWVSCLESHCRAAKLIERLVFVLIKKAPVMTLGLMRSDDFVVSTHRAPWHGSSF